MLVRLQKLHVLILLMCASSVVLVVLFADKKDIEYSFEARTNISKKLKLRDLIKCEDKLVEYKIEQKGDFFVLKNYVKASRTFACHESITYTTQADYSFLDNVPTLVSRWMGPISIALYAPGGDFGPTIDSIAYLRNCGPSIVKEYVTFHIFFLSGHFPDQKKILFDDFNDTYDCKKKPPYEDIIHGSLYKQKHNLTYPINVARNIARQTATTHYVFASDIELYPTPNFIKKFLGMIADNPAYQSRKIPRVYALPIFEINENETVPENKTRLQEMLKSKKAFLFHRTICPICHSVPKYKEWLVLPETDGIHVFTIGKRTGANRAWEAFYVGTNNDPEFDERLTWEGQSNKMSQGFSLCLLNYDYMVLDNAFLIHKPGIKKSKEQLLKYGDLIGKTNYFIRKTIKPELIQIYGHRDGCHL